MKTGLFSSGHYLNPEFRLMVHRLRYQRSVRHNLHPVHKLDVNPSDSRGQAVKHHGVSRAQVQAIAMALEQG